MGLGYAIRISLIASFFTSVAFAADEISLEGVEVTAVSGGYNVDEAKVTTRNATLLKDVFRDIPGVYVGGTNGMNQKIYMRGVSDRGLNITIDGAKQNGNTFHHNADMLIDPDLIKAVEVEVGSRSVVNGSGALGGSVAFKTVDASDLLENGQAVGAKLKMGYTSNNQGFSQSAMLYGRAFDSLDLLAAFKHYGYGFGESGNNKRVGGDGNDINYLFKAGYNFLDHHKISLSTEHMQYKGLYPGRAEFPGYVNALIGGVARTNNITNILYERDTHTIKYTYNPSDLLELDVTGYYTKHERDGVDRRGDASESRWGVETKGGKIAAKTIVETGSFSHTLRYGFDYYQSENYTKKPKGARPEQIDNYSLYLEDAIKFGDLTITPGIRYEHHTLKSYDGTGANITSYKYKFDQFSPALALDYNIGYGFGLFASYARVFKGPDISESMRAGGTRWAKNENLKATTGNAYEFGGRYKTDLGKDSSLNLIAKYYKTEYKNLIDDDYATGSGAAQTYSKTNTGGADISGVELFARLNVQNLSVAAGYTHQNLKYKDRVKSGTDYAASKIIGYRDQGDKYTLNTEYYIPATDLFVGYNMLLFKSKNTISANNDTNVKMPSYAVHDIYATYAPTSGRFKGLEVNAGIYNLFDKAYASHSQRTAQYTGDAANIDWEAGRNFKVNVSYKF